MKRNTLVKLTALLLAGSVAAPSFSVPVSAEENSVSVQENAEVGELQEEDSRESEADAAVELEGAVIETHDAAQSAGDEEAEANNGGIPVETAGTGGASSLAEPAETENSSKDTAAESEAETEGLNSTVVNGSEIYYTDGEVYINPIYADVTEEDEIEIPEISDVIPSADSTGRRRARSMNGTTYLDTAEEAGAVLREGMKNREESIVIYYSGEEFTQEYFSELCKEQIIPAALAETDDPAEGDYLKYNYGGAGFRGSMSTDEDGNYTLYTLTFTPKYYTTAEQEAEVTAKVDELLDGELSFTNAASDFKKISAVHNYICSSVTYDYANLGDSDYKLKYTTYAALIDGTAVCQGYSTLNYRLLRELGINARVTTGYGGPRHEDYEDDSMYPGNHAWNRVKCGNSWYFDDTTWDANYSDEVAAGTYSYQYLLKGYGDFDSIDEPFYTSGIHIDMMDDDFNAAYPVEENRYIQGDEEEEHVDVWGPWKKNYPAGIYRECECGKRQEVSNPFTDLKDDPYYTAILWAVANEITSGSTPTTFNQNGACTRAQVAAFLWRAAGCPEPETTVNPFTDVSKTSIFYKPIMWAYENGITSGTTAKTFGPNVTCTREQIVTFLWRAAGSPDPETTVNPFKDIKSTRKTYKAILWAVENGITSGRTANVFAPTDTCTRGQVVTFIYRSSEEA